MKTPTNIGSNVLSMWLQTATEIRMADLYTITLKAGTVLRYTTWDTNLVVSGNTFLTGPPNIARTAIEEKLGMDISTIDVTITASLADLLNGVPVLQSIGLGLFDGAAFKIERLFMDATGQQIGTVIRFAGFIGAVDELTRSSAKLQIESGTKLLQMDLPAILLQPACTNTLFDARCTLVKTNMLQFSEQVDNPAWILTNLSVTPNATVAPDGTSNADKITRVATVTTEASATQTRIAVAAGTPLTMSCYAKAGTAGAFLDLRLIYVDPTPPSSVVAFDLTNGIIAFTGSSYTGKASIVAVGNGWYRCSITGSAVASPAANRADIGVTTSSIGGLGGAAGDFIYVWGAQLELGPTATSYTSTTTSGASFSEWNVVQSATANKIISLSAKPDAYFDNGQLAFITGPNAGLVKAIKTFLGQQFTFNSPLPFPPNAGDTFIAYPGCDKTQSTCTNKFGNLVNFEGMPYVPVPETAI